MAKQKIVAIIQARGGSKRIPLKNLKPINGKPLIWYPIQLAKSSGLVDRVIVSSDHAGILEAARASGAETPFVRPADISEDVPTEMVTGHALKWLADNEGYHPDLAITLTPATPFTKPADLKKGLELLLAHPEWDAVVTVRKAREFPAWMIDLGPDGSGKTLLGNSFDGEYNVSQNLKRYYYPMGAFFINRVEAFLKKPSMYSERYGCVELDPSEHVDIDEPEDLKQAELVARTLFPGFA
ncbi:MAG: acylneuraminate cytidylyltransferase family protein [Deltaproteobacteria bacterium]|nr:acylneuraminate cytidylyltransferase family protein [Deltaproteobacteria bacterium]